LYCPASLEFFLWKESPVKFSILIHFDKKGCKMVTVGIIGLGLMGGSLGLALKGKYRVVGYDRNEKHVVEALEIGIVDEVVSFEEVQKVDILFLAIPVEGIISAIESFSNLGKETTIIDLGSTKEKIVEKVPAEIRENFIPAHPMAGTEKSGPTASIKELYRDRVVVLCDLEKSGEKQKKDAFEIFNFLEMRIVEMNSKEHDKHTAWISHLPHLISFSLANSVMAQENRESILNLSAGGFRDMSRLAKSSPNMWRDIFYQNRENLLESIELFQKELNHMKILLQNLEMDRVKERMVSANRLHDIL
jgi:prephenate dehydrogenase